MIYLDTPNKKLEIVLGSTVTTNQLEVSAFYYDTIPTDNSAAQNRGGVKNSLTNNTTDVTIVAAPSGVGRVRNVHTIFVYNKDTVSATVTIKLDNSGSETVFVKQTIRTNEGLVYEDQSGWTVLSPVAISLVGNNDLTFVTSGSTTITLPTSGTMATLAGTESLTNKTLDNSNIITVRDDRFTIQDNSDTSKQAVFQASGITTATTRTYTLPNVSGELYAAGGTDVPVTDGGTGRSTGTTAYSLIATGTTATGAQQTLANGATTEILVGGGASALPVWTTATGSGAPVRATSPTLVTPALGTPTSGTLDNCTAATQTAGDNSTKLSSTAYADRMRVTLGTAQASTSGTSIDFTSIPSGVKKITLSFIGVSHDATAGMMVQIGDSGGVEATGYLGGSGAVNAAGGTPGSVGITTGFSADRPDTSAATAVRHGAMILTLENSSANTWSMTSTGFDSVNQCAYWSAGRKSLSATLDRVRITTIAGTANFDAGEINIAYEL